MSWVSRLISFAVFLQLLELLFIKPWPPEIRLGEMSRIFRRAFKEYSSALYVGVLLAGYGVYQPSAMSLFFQLLSVWVVAITWRGTFNGGSDFMTFQILLAALLAALKPDYEWACLFYISFQISLSYFISGLAKLRQPGWRNGQTLPHFLNSKRRKLVGLSWAAIGFECLFPLGLVHPGICCVFLAAGMVFHLMNFYYFGLNRFFFVWIAGYPAILLTSLYLHSKL